MIGRWTTLLAALAETQGYRPSVTDEAVLSAVIRQLVGADDGYTALRPLTIPDVARGLADPTDDLIAAGRFAGRREWLDHTRSITDALTNLIVGPLAGLFDAPTNFDLDWDAPVQSMDLSRLRSRGDEAIAVALTCLGSWSSLITDLQDDGEIRIVVRDEVWRQMRLGLRAVQAVDADLRLSRADKQIQLLVLHKPSDLLSVGAAGSQEATIAADLLALCSTRILLGQSTRVADALAADLALTEQEQHALTGWAMHRRGRALWKIETLPGVKVQTVLSTAEAAIFDTNAQLRRRSSDRRRVPPVTAPSSAVTPPRWPEDEPAVTSRWRWSRRCWWSLVVLPGVDAGPGRGRRAGRGGRRWRLRRRRRHRRRQPADRRAGVVGRADRQRPHHRRRRRRAAGCPSGPR